MNYLEAEEGSRLANESERSTNVYFLDDIKGIIRCRVKHFVICKTSYSIKTNLSMHFCHNVRDRNLPLLMIWLILPNFLCGTRGCKPRVKKFYGQRTGLWRRQSSLENHPPQRHRQQPTLHHQTSGSLLPHFLIASRQYWIQKKG